MKEAFKVCANPGCENLARVKFCCIECYGESKRLPPEKLAKNRTGYMDKYTKKRGQRRR